MHKAVKWADLKAFATARNLSIQWIVSNNLYYLAAIDGSMELTAQIPLVTPTPDGSDQQDFENNFQGTGNQSPTASVTTQYEQNNKDLKLAKSTIDLDDSTTGSATIQIPGVFGSTDGRYVAGGYAICGDYDIDDFVTVHIEDTDRLIALAVAQSQDASATEPVSDEIMQGLGVIPLIGQAVPEYPIVKSYTDDELAPENQGWYFWPLALGSDLPPAGECEIEPIGGYGFLPAKMYIVITYTRAIKTTGKLRINYYWGKKE